MNKEWQKLLKSVKGRKTIRPITTEELDACEEELRVKLPASYRSYCQSLGPGKIANWYTITTPGYRGRYNTAYNLNAKNSFYHSRLDWREYSKDATQYEKAVIFADDDAGAIYFWDPREKTARRRHEYAIYATFRDWSLERVCDTFSEFISICLHQHQRTLYKTKPELRFDPAPGWKREGRKQPS